MVSFTEVVKVRRNTFEEHWVGRNQKFHAGHSRLEML